jgi:hypothetical protein
VIHAVIENDMVVALSMFCLDVEFSLSLMGFAPRAQFNLTKKMATFSALLLRASGLASRCLFPIFKVITPVTGLDNVTLMGHSIQKGGGHIGIANHLRSLAKAQIRGHDHGCLLVEPAQQTEQDCEDYGHVVILPVNNTLQGGID